MQSVVIPVAEGCYAAGIEPLSVAALTRSALICKASPSWLSPAIGLVPVDTAKYHSEETYAYQAGTDRAAPNYACLELAALRN